MSAIKIRAKEVQHFRVQVHLVYSVHFPQQPWCCFNKEKYLCKNERAVRGVHQGADWALWLSALKHKRRFQGNISNFNFWNMFFRKWCKQNDICQSLKWEATSFGECSILKGVVITISYQGRGFWMYARIAFWRHLTFALKE